MSNDNEHMRRYMADRYRRRKERAQRLLGDQCSKCGSTKGLEFDHIDPAQKGFTITQRLAGVAESKLMAELAKCQLLCEDCHTKKHLSTALCGTVQRYWRGCKCEDCLRAYREHMRKWRKKRKGV